MRDTPPINRHYQAGVAAAFLATMAMPGARATAGARVLKVEDVAAFRKYSKVALMGYGIEQQTLRRRVAGCDAGHHGSPQRGAAGLEGGRWGGLRDDPLHADLKGKTPLPSPRLACLAHPVRHEDAARFSAGNEMSANLSRASSGKKPVAGGRAVQEALTKRRGITLLKAYYVVGFGEAGGGVSETRAFNPATNRSEKTMSGAARATADEKRYLDSAEAMIQTVPSRFVDALKTAAANRFSGRCAA